MSQKRRGRQYSWGIEPGDVYTNEQVCLLTTPSEELREVRINKRSYNILVVPYSVIEKLLKNADATFEPFVREGQRRWRLARPLLRAWAKRDVARNVTRAA